VLSFQIFD